MQARFPIVIPRIINGDAIAIVTTVNKCHVSLSPYLNINLPPDPLIAVPVLAYIAKISLVLV